MKRPVQLLAFTLGIWVLAAVPATAATYTVDAGGGGDFTRIQDCIDAASDGDTCEVLPGTYVENLDFLGRNITVRSTGGPETTIIDGNQAGSVVTFQSGETQDARLEGFTITNGYTEKGGGIFCEASSSPTITGCTISGNSAWYGGGIWCESASPIITNCTISGNYAWYGGGIWAKDSSPTITYCTINENGVVQMFGMFLAHSARGGGILCQGGSSTITNCIVSGNISDEALGTGICCTDGSAVITNCTISGNTGSGDYDLGGGITCFESSVTIINCVFWNNFDSWGVNEIAVGPYLHYPSPSPSILTIRYSDVQGGEAGVYISSQNSTLIWGDGNIDQDPLFVSGPLGDYYLSQTAAGQGVQSPCVDAGDPATEPWGWAELTTRTDGVTDSGTVDMGFHHAPGPVDLAPYYNLTHGTNLLYLQFKDQGAGWEYDLLRLETITALGSGYLGQVVAFDSTAGWANQWMDVFEPQTDGAYFLGAYDLQEAEWQLFSSPPMGPVGGEMTAGDPVVAEGLWIDPQSGESDEVVFYTILVEAGLSFETPAGTFDDCVLIVQDLVRDGVYARHFVEILARDVGRVLRVEYDIESGQPVPSHMRILAQILDLP